MGIKCKTRNRWVLVGTLAAASSLASAQQGVRVGGSALTIANIFKEHGGPVGEAPQDFVWQPDGRAVTYLSADHEHGQPGDVISVQATTGDAKTLVTGDKINSQYEHANDVRDLDHRSRYDLSTYFWTRDGKHLVFDATGQIWLHDLATDTGKLLADTGVGSGDDPKISPDGRMLSFVRDHNLHVLPLDGSAETSLTTTQSPTVLNGEVDWVYEEELDVTSNYFWAPDSKHLAYVQMDETAVPKYPLVDWTTLHTTVEEQRYPQPGDANPGVRVGVVAVQGGQTSWLALPITANNDYIPRLGWINRRTVWVEVLRRDHKHRELYFADISTGNVRLVLTETAHHFFDESYNIRFLSQGKFLWTSWKDGHTHIYLYSYSQKHPMQRDVVLDKQLTRGNWEVLSIAGVSEKSGAVFYTSNETDPREELLWEIQLDGTGKRMLSTVHGVHKISLNQDGTGYVDTWSSLMESPVVSVCQIPADCHSFWKGRGLDGTRLVKPKIIESEAADGTILYGTLLLPPTMSRIASVPLIVNPYGGPHAQLVRNEWAKGMLFDQLLMQHGFAVLHVDNRGTGNRGRDFAEAAYRNFGSIQFQDQMAVLNQVLAQYPQLDAKRLGWWGWSWGGTFTLYAMTHSDRFTAGVAVAPVTDWHAYDSIYTERYMGTPTENAQGYREDSVVNRAGKLQGHLLLAHGTGDDNVHIQNSIEFIQGLVSAGKQYDLLLYPGLTHSLDTSSARTQLYERILEHFETFLQDKK